MAKKIVTAEEPVLHRGDRACRGAELGRGVAKRLPRLLDVPIAARRIGVPGLNVGRAITPPLDGNSAGAHPIAPGIARAAARGGYPYHEGTAGRYSCPGDSARHDNARRIRSAPVAGSARPRGSPWTSTPPSPTEPSAPHRHSGSDSGQAARAVQPDLTQ